MKYVENQRRQDYGRPVYGNGRRRLYGRRTSDGIESDCMAAMRKFDKQITKLKKVIRFIPLVLFIVIVFYLFFLYVISVVTGRTVTMDNF